MRLLFLLLLFLPFFDKPGYNLFNSKGKKTSYSKLLSDAKEADIILFGELHNNPISHWLQIELTKDLYTYKRQNLVLGAEMFENDDQLILDEYLQSLIPYRHFKNEAKLWPNFETDYKPLLEFAKKNDLNFFATNVPRRYASFVASNSLDSLKNLSEESLNYLPPLPIDTNFSLPSYAAMQNMQHGMHGQMMFLAQAQALKDATMSHFILKNFSPGQTFLHFNGAYHSNNYEGLYWYLKNNKKGLKILTISTVEQEDIEVLKEDSEKLADYIIVVPESMTKTH